MKIDNGLIGQYAAVARPGTDGMTIAIHGPDGSQIGEYQRNYHSLFNTFMPFKKNGKCYALYSPDYTCTRIMSLPDCKDIGGEEPYGHGFCPVDYAIPYGQYRTLRVPRPYNPRHNPDSWATKTTTIVADNKTISYKWPTDGDKLWAEFDAACRKADADFKEWIESNPYDSVWFNAEFGFVAGCYWGDDSSWKIQHLDLSEADKGIILRDDRYGYISLGCDLLHDAINLDFWTPEHKMVKITHDTIFDMDKVHA